jgi:DNA replication protein DnaC/primosomal protein DnaI
MMETWEEQLKDLLFVFDRDPKTTPVSERRILEIRSLRPLAKRQAAAGVPPAYHEALLSTWDDSRSNPETKLIVEHYLANPIHSLFLHGAVGVGKTWAACAIANELLKKGKALRFQPVSELLLGLKDSFTQEGVSEKAVLQPFLETGFLVLDELGALAGSRDKTASNFTATTILTVLDIRSRNRRPTILTSNLNLGQLERWSDDPRISSRIAEACTLQGVFEISGRDLRTEKEEMVPCP